MNNHFRRTWLQNKVIHFKKVAIIQYLKIRYFINICLLKSLFNSYMLPAQRLFADAYPSEHTVTYGEELCCIGTGGHQQNAITVAMLNVSMDTEN
jgi:hypothetical protein